MKGTRFSDVKGDAVYFALAPEKGIERAWPSTRPPRGSGCLAPEKGIESVPQDVHGHLHILVGVGPTAPARWSRLAHALSPPYAKDEAEDTAYLYGVGIVKVPDPAIDLQALALPQDDLSVPR